MNSPYDQGWSAYWRGVDQDANPYTDSEPRDEWNLGWVNAQRADKDGI